MFPFDMDEEDEQELMADTESEDEKEPAPEYEIDFDTMTLTGRMITGIPAVKQWIKIALGVPRYEHTQYSWSYGSEFESLIGQGYTEEDLKPIMERMVIEALSQNEDIISAHGFSVTKEGSHVTLEFTVDTIYGETDISEEVEV